MTEGRLCFLLFRDMPWANPILSVHSSWCGMPFVYPASFPGRAASPPPGDCGPDRPAPRLPHRGRQGPATKNIGRRLRQSGINRRQLMKLWKALALGVALAAMTAGGALAQGKWSKIRIATEGAYAPWNFTAAGGKLDGFEVDLAGELCKRMNAQCEVVAQDWDGIIPALNASKYDAIMAGMNITDKRMEAVNFTRPYAGGPHGWGVLKKSPL